MESILVVLREIIAVATLADSKALMCVGQLGAELVVQTAAYWASK